MKILKYYIEAIFVKLAFFLIKKLSIDQSSYLLGKIAKIIGPLLPISKIAITNIKIAFPEKTTDDIKEIISKMWENIGRIFGELPHIYSISDDDFRKRVEIIGIENIDSKELENKTLIFFSGHIANWEVSVRVPILLKMKLALIYRKANNKMVDDIINNERRKPGIKLIAKGKKDAKLLLRYLKEEINLAMLVDQKMNDGIAVDFFNKKAMTAPAIAKLAKQFNKSIIPAQVIRNNGANFTVKIYPKLEISSSDDNHLTMLKINKIIEDWIIEHPEQYFWLHKRWDKENY